MVNAPGEARNDNGGRRTGVDRRQFSYSTYIPERRTEKERRSGSDRRKREDPEFPGMERRVFPYIDPDITPDDPPNES